MSCWNERQDTRDCGRRLREHQTGQCQTKLTTSDVVRRRMKGLWKGMLVWESGRREFHGGCVQQGGRSEEEGLGWRGQDVFWT